MPHHPAPRKITRRAWLTTAGCAASAAVLAPALVRAQPRRAKLRMLLNTGISSPQAWLWLAQTRGYLEREGLELDLTPGAGAYTAAPRMIDGGYDIAYGDVNSLIEEAAHRPDAAPQGVYMMFNASPSCVAVAADGPLRHARDLVGRSLVGHDTDVALRTFGALCLHHQLDSRSVRVASAWAGMAGMVEQVLAGQADGAFGYVSTFTGALVSADPALLNRVRFLTFAEFAPDLYGSVLMASRRLLREQPAAVSALVRALNRGVQDLLRSPQAGMDALAKVAPGTDRPAEQARLKATLDLEMNPALPAAARRLPLGEVDEARLARSIALMAKANQLPRVPGVAEVFTAAYLPPVAERARPV
jgi:NitT/TauT family transport system substrate-binding protein